MIILIRWRTARTAPSWNSRGRSRRSRSFSQWWVAFVQTSKRKLGKVKVVDLTSKKFNLNSFPLVLSISSKSACFVTLLLISMTMVMKMTTASFRGLTGDFAGGLFSKGKVGRVSKTDEGLWLHIQYSHIYKHIVFFAPKKYTILMLIVHKQSFICVM